MILVLAFQTDFLNFPARYFNKPKKELPYSKAPRITARGKGYQD
jgi:hypothetical protein